MKISERFVTMRIGGFLPDILAAMLVHRTKEKNVFQEFDSKYYYAKH